jgi:hypothetical protein
MMWIVMMARSLWLSLRSQKRPDPLRRSLHQANRTISREVRRKMKVTSH